MSGSPFTRRANNTEVEDWELPPSGLHPAVCIGLVDLGTHDNDYDDKKKRNRLLFIAWELVGTQSNNGTPFVVAESYTDSLGKNANLRKMLEGWRGKPFNTDEEFDPINLLGLKCVVNLSLSESKTSDKQFCRVNSVARPMKGQNIGDATRQVFFWHFMDLDRNAPPPIPDWMPRHFGKLVLDRIKMSYEWHEAEAKGFFAKPAAAQQAKPATQAPKASNGSHPGPSAVHHPSPAETAAEMASYEPAPF